MEKKDIICKISDKYAKLITEINDKVWEYAEEGMREHKSAAYLIDVCKNQGFTVTAPVAGIKTAFVAEWGSGSPVVGFLAEYDALPGLKQNRADPAQTGCKADDWGHGCGHNTLGAGAAGAAFILKDYFEQRGSGTVRFFGCPGEEYGSGKTFMARAGMFDSLDVCYTWHPDDRNAVWGDSSLACLNIYYTFKGRSAHAAGSPHLGRSALDACELMNIGANYLREHMEPEARLHYAYTDAGGKAPNVVQDYARVNYFVRHPNVKGMMELFERVNDIARGAALMSGTQMEYEIIEGLCDYIPSDALNLVCDEAFREIGAPQFDDEDIKLADSFHRTLSDASIDEFYTSLRKSGINGKLVPREWSICQNVLPYFLQDAAMGGSTDVGDVSYCVPTCQITTACEAIGTPGHSWQMTAQSGSSLAHKGAICAARVLALAAAKTADMPQVIAQAKQELKEKNNGGYVCPIPDSVMPIE